mgnify:CR=1 FL=1
MLKLYEVLCGYAALTQIYDLLKVVPFFGPRDIQSKDSYLVKSLFENSNSWNMYTSDRMTVK